MARPADGIPQDIAEHMRLMCDILVLGFQTDTTRITTLKLNNDHSALRFPNLPSVQQAGHGIENDSANYLVPVNADIKKRADIAPQSLSVKRVADRRRAIEGTR